MQRERMRGRATSGRQCVWAGEASCLMEITYQDSTLSKVLTQLGSGKATTVFNEYGITLEVQPYPEAGKSINKNDYRIVLIITK